MYNSPPPGGAVAGLIGVGSGTLAVTGISALTLAMISALLIVCGLILVRIAYLARCERQDAAVAA
jgi:hypothetical protein